MKVVRWVGIVFAIVGLSLLGAGIFVWLGPTLVFGRTAQVQGTVVEYEISMSDGTRMYAPVVTYAPPGGDWGEDYRVTDNVRTSWRSYDVGERVPVRYDPDDPRDASIGTGMPIYGYFFLAMGAVFFVVGGGMLVRPILARRKLAALSVDGRRQSATITGVHLNRSFQVNGRHPYRIHAQYTTDGGRGIRTVRSPNLWYDPTPFVEIGGEITVLVDRRRESRYAMDVSGLPVLQE